MKSFFRFFGVALITAYGFAPLLVLAAPPAPTCFMSTNPSSVNIGGSVTLTWGSTDATNVAITNVGNVEPNGQRNLLPSGALTTTYFGSFSGPGGTANCSASVTVVSNVNNNPSGSTGGGTGSSFSGETTAGGGSPTTVDGSNGIFGSNTNIGSSPSSNTGDANGGGIVSCGTGAGNLAATNCQACDLAKLVQRIINFLIGVSIPIAAGLFAVAGILYFSSGARPQNIELAHKVFGNTFVGFLIVLGAWLIINTTLHILLNQTQFSNGSWFKIDCTGNRQIEGDPGNIFTGLPGLNTAPLPSGNIAVACNYQDVWQGGQCYNPLTGTNRSPTAVTCQEGSTYNAAAFVCQNGEGEITAPKQNTTITVSGVGTAGATAGDLLLRQQLADAGITVNSSGNCADRTKTACTSLDGMSNQAVADMIALNQSIPIRMSGGTEVGHQAKCQSGGTCPDVTPTDPYYVRSAEGVNKFLDASKSLGRCPVFEPGPGGSCPAGVPAKSCQTGVGTAPHYSFYPC